MNQTLTHTPQWTGTPGLQEIALILFIFLAAIGSIVITLIPFWFIFKKAGFHPALSILTAVPVVNFIILYYIAFSTWPALTRKSPSETKLS